MSITQENIRNIIVEAGEMDKLLSYVGTTPLKLNDILTRQIADIMTELREQELDIDFFAKIASILEAKGLPESQVKQALMVMANVRKDERERLRTVTVGYGEPFVTGRLHSSLVIFQGVGKLLQCFLYTNGTNPATIDLFDSPDLSDTQDSAHLMRVSCRGGDFINSDSFKEEIGFSSLTCLLQGEGASYNLCYKILEPGQQKN